MEIGANILNQQLGTSLDPEQVGAALSGLIGDGKGGIDLGSLVSKMTASGDLSSIVSSWLGDGANAAITPDKIVSMLGESNVTDFASKLGVDADAAAGGLAEALPQMLDKASSGGNLLDSVGGVGGLLGAAKSFFS
jgi:uncharacterized protein YidB (DUF937 family)